MSRPIVVLCSAALVALLAMSALHSEEAKRAHYIDLTADFSRFVDDTDGMEDAGRVALFHKRMDTLLPGFDERTLRHAADRVRLVYCPFAQGFP